MFLTRVRLNPKRRKTRDLIRNRNVGHGLVEGCTHGEGRTLWRVDTSHRDHVDLYLYTPVRPSVHPIVEQCGWPEQFDDTVRIADCSDTLDAVRVGDRFRFRVTVSPQRRTATTSRGLNTDAEVRQWFSEREDGWGFSTEGNFSLPVVGRSHYSRNGARSVALAQAEVDGVLTVTDAEGFRKAVTGGIGRAKHAGFGMLLLSPLG